MKHKHPTIKRQTKREKKQTNGTYEPIFPTVVSQCRSHAFCCYPIFNAILNDDDDVNGKPKQPLTRQMNANNKGVRQNECRHLCLQFADHHDEDDDETSTHDNVSTGKHKSKASEGF